MNETTENKTDHAPGTVRDALNLLYSTMDEETSAHASNEEIDASTRKFNEAVKILETIAKAEGGAS